MIDLTKKPIVLSQLSFSERKLKYEKDVVEVNNQLLVRSGHVILGNSPRSIRFLYAVYKAQKAEDFDEALMRETYFIELYGKEQVEECSVFSIITMADSVSFADKKKFMQKLLHKDYDCKPEAKIKHEFAPTLKDKEFAFWTKYKEFAPLIIQEIYCIRYSDLDIPQDIKDYIAKLLFWFKLDQKESLL